MGNSYHPAGNASTDGVRARIEGVVEYVRGQTASSGPEAKRAGSLAITSFEQGVMWVERAFGASDFVVGDDGGAQGPDRSERPVEAAEEHDGQSDP
jgi:hypothetical protein